MPQILNHNVYILGAGFSRDAGLPVIKDFLERMGDSIEWLHARDRKDEADAIEDVFKFRLKAAGTAYRCDIDVENIEHLFSLASASEGQSHTDYVTKAIAATLDFAKANTPMPQAYFHTQTTHTFNGWRVLDRDESAKIGGFTHSCPLYHLYAGVLSGFFCDKSPSMKNTIITFNYDTLIEDALSDLGVPFHYGLSSSSATLKYGAKCSFDDQATPNAIPILKLHGSMNWANAHNEKVGIYGTYEDLRVSNGGSVLLLPPTWRKAFGGNLMGVWETALKSISEATRIIILGFSMPSTDAHFKYLLAAGLRDNISLRKLIFVNPGLSDKKPEKEQLRKNLFNILRPELEQREIIITSSLYTDEYLLKGNPETIIINRNISPNYSRIIIEKNNVQIQIRN